MEFGRGFVLAGWLLRVQAEAGNSPLCFRADVVMRVYPATLTALANGDLVCVRYGFPHLSSEAVDEAAMLP